MAKEVPWALAAPRTDRSRESKPALLPSNPRMGSARWRFHPERSSSQPNIPTPSRRWKTRSPAGTRNHWRGRRRITGPATPGPRTRSKLPPSARGHGWLGPRVNHNNTSIPAHNSIMGQYDRLQNRHGRGNPWTQRDTPSTRPPRTMDPALGDGSVLTRRSSRRAYRRSPAACAVTIAPRGAVRSSIRRALFLSSSERRISAEAIEHGEEPPIMGATWSTSAVVSGTWSKSYLRSSVANRSQSNHRSPRPFVGRTAQRTEPRGQRPSGARAPGHGLPCVLGGR